MQEREEHRDLRRGEKVAARVRGAAHPPRLQRAAEVCKARSRRAHQNDDVLLAHGTQLLRLIVLYREFTCQHIADIIRDERGLGLARAHAPLARLRRQVEQVELRAAAIGRQIARAGAQHFVLAVVKLAHFLGKNVAEDEIRRLQHLLARAEIAREQ